MKTIYITAALLCFTILCISDSTVNSLSLPTAILNDSNESIDTSAVSQEVQSRVWRPGNNSGESNEKSENLSKKSQEQSNEKPWRPGNDSNETEERPSKNSQEDSNESPWKPGRDSNESNDRPRKG